MISVVILTKDEEKNIKDCIKSVEWCDEIIVIDDISTDKTVSIAEKMGAKVYKKDLDSNFSAQRNMGLSKAKGDWVFFVDADERVSSALWYEIMGRTTNQLDNIKGFYIKRLDNMWGRNLTHGDTKGAKFLRLAKKSAGEWFGTVHEEWRIEGATATLNNVLNHFPHQSVAGFINEINFYSSLRAKELHNKNTKVNFFSIVLYPNAKFIKDYVVLGGFMDGLPGFVHAVLMSMHSFLVRSKLFLLQNK